MGGWVRCGHRGGRGVAGRWVGPFWSWTRRPPRRRGIPIPSRFSRIFLLWPPGDSDASLGGFGRDQSAPGLVEACPGGGVVPYVSVTRGKFDVEERERRICRLLTVARGCSTAPGLLFSGGRASRPLVLEMDITDQSRAAFLRSPSFINPTKRN